ncbi:aspartate/glutamate racemase family protein [Oceanibium sediminis]|uniref:aspartate/glutamate racemase family protein n=1 Tax=Oceanibium sediminis TaxID=2026339 RepID=UPI000DD38707|nr:aspartate/glutamate racemase family protein [Oceanibium sediminis]
MKLVLINPNTSEHVTERMVRQARVTAAGGAKIEGVTAAFGPRIIGSRAENGLAVHGALDAAARRAQDADAIILGVSMDTGLRELRDLMPIPVVGMAQAALMAAAHLGTRIGCLTIGPQMLPLYQEVTDNYGFGDQAIWRAIEVPGIFEDPPASDVADVLAERCREAVQADGVDVIMLCGAVLTGYLPLVAPRVPVPVIDCIDAATRMAMMLVAMTGDLPRNGAPAAGGRQSVGLDPALAQLLAAGST